MPNTSTNHICAQCSKRQLTCCQDSEPFVTLGDIARIQCVYKKPFFERRAAGQPYIEAISMWDDPLWNEVTIINGTRRVLKKAKNGVDCIFLKKDGCSLPHETKPLVCRLYPFDFTEKKLMVLEPACPKDLAGKDPTKTIGITKKEAKVWLKQLYQELKSEKLKREKFGRSMLIP